MQKLAAVQETPSNELPSVTVDPLGLGTTDHFVPSQDSTRVLETVIM
jgi:hypothetical protein